MSKRDALGYVCVGALFACACAYCLYWLGRML